MKLVFDENVFECSECKTWYKKSFYSKKRKLCLLCLIKKERENEQIQTTRKTVKKG